VGVCTGQRQAASAGVHSHLAAARQRRRDLRVAGGRTVVQGIRHAANRRH